MEHLRSSTCEQRTLIARANDGDRAALEQLYRDHRDWVTAIAYRFTGTQDDALDVLQETFVYFFSKFPGFTLRSSIRSFLYPVVKHTSITVLRRRRGIVDLDSYRKNESSLGTTVEWGFPDLARSDVSRLLATLPDGQREVVRLRFGLGFRLEEIADALSIPVGTVKSRLHNALKSLRSQIDSGGRTRKPAINRQEPQRNGGRR